LGSCFLFTGGQKMTGSTAEVNAVIYD
jgi:hypothetical protein